MRIELDLEPLLHDLDALGEELAGKALMRALNRTIKGVRTETIRIVRGELNLKVADVKKGLSIRRARSRDSSAALEVWAAPTPTARYAARQTKRGVTVKVKRKGGRKLIAGAFLARMRSGHVGVYSAPKGGYTRRGPAPNRSGLPIHELFSTALVQYIDDPKVLARIGTVARGRFERELVSQIAFLRGA